MALGRRSRLQRRGGLRIGRLHPERSSKISTASWVFFLCNLAWVRERAE